MNGSIPVEAPSPAAISHPNLHWAPPCAAGGYRGADDRPAHFIEHNNLGANASIREHLADLLALRLRRDSILAEE
jgi:hypothetical protein